MPVVIPRTPASAMSATSAQPSKPLLSTHEKRSDSAKTLAPPPPTTTSTSTTHHHTTTHHPNHPTTIQPPTTRRTLHYNTPQSALSPRTPAAATAAAADGLVDLDSWQADTETQLERLILSAELVLSQEKARARLGLGGAREGGGVGELDDGDERVVRDLIAQARKLEYGAGKELHDIQRSVKAEEKEATTPADKAGGGGGGDGYAKQSGGGGGAGAEHVRQLNEYVAILEAKVDDLQSELDKQAPALATRSAERQARQQLAAQLADERGRCEAAEDALHGVQAEQRAAQQAAAQLTARLDDVSGLYDGAEALLAEERERGARWMREAHESRAERRRAEDALVQMAGREAVVREECERRLGMYEKVRRESVRVKMLGVLAVGLLLLSTGATPWLSELMRADPRYYTY